MVKVTKPKPPKPVKKIIDSVVVVGSSTMEQPQCRKIARQLLNKLVDAYPLTRVYTVKECPLGVEIRKYAKQLGLKRLGSSVEAQTHYDREAMAIGHLMWKSQRYIIYWDGQRGLARECIEACMRMKKPFKMFEV